ncbi:hypothetical protein KIN20_031916 [Parelaphostrongylus tenuis]|uniref:Secreted protein n=1 Tax=Parelaphostrongylus tenuis TaxID=148309 RepID=A0AAD5R5R4_PARTN|nr:hypothetical protein KIN20_031916 [Parelaphostrongylus tenuis]
MARRAIGPCMISMLATVSAVFGCGVLPAGHVRIGNFTIIGFTTLPVAMARTITAEVSTQHPGLGVPSPAPFVRRLVMRAVFRVLQDQGRRALLPDPIIFSILDQLNVTTTFEPLFCNKAVQDLTNDMVTEDGALLDSLLLSADPTFDRCVIVGDTVTAICPKSSMAPALLCMTTLTPIPDRHLKIAGAISTSNIIMANWSRAMWQSVVDQAVRLIATDPFGTHFFAATATVF